MEQYLTKKGRRLIGCDEIAECDIDTSAVIMSWRGHEGGFDAAAKGHDVIMAPTGSMYFDYYQLPEDLWEKPFLIGGYVSLSKVYAFDPAPDSLSADVRRHIIGAQANLWTEYIPYKELLEYQVLPRMAALCEVQWTDPERKDYDAFLRRLPRLLSIYDAQGWKYCRKRDNGETLNVEH
jgi:hexosaminidase